MILGREGIGMHTPAAHFPRLLTVNNLKILKSLGLGYRTYALHLAPATRGGAEMCHWRSAGCTAACLNLSGHGGMIPKSTGTNAVQEARKRRTQFFNNDRELFMQTLVQDIRDGSTRALKDGLIPVFRLNTTSDVLWERIPVTVNGHTFNNVFEVFPDTQFYDYTKAPLGMRQYSKPDNYHLTFSLSESNEQRARACAAAGMNIAVVFRKKPFPETFWGLKVVDGDETDLRFLDPKGVIVGLKAKGPGRKDYSGFVQDIKEVVLV